MDEGPAGCQRRTLTKKKVKQQQQQQQQQQTKTRSSKTTAKLITMCIVFYFLNNFSAGHTSLLRSTDVTVAITLSISPPFRPFVPHSPTIHNAGIPCLSVNAGYYCTETLVFISRPGVFTTVEPR